MIKPSHNTWKRIASFSVFLLATFASFFALTVLIMPRMKPFETVKNIDSKVTFEMRDEVVTSKKYCGEIRLNDFHISEKKGNNPIFSMTIGEAIIGSVVDGERTASLKNLSVSFFSGGGSPEHFYDSKQGFDYDMSRKLSETLKKQLDVDIVKIENIVVSFYEDGYVSSVLLGDKGFINDGIGGFLIYGHVNIMERFGNKLSSDKILWTQADDKFHIEDGFSLCRGVESKKGKKVIVDYMLNEVREASSKQAFYISG